MWWVWGDELEFGGLGVGDNTGGGRAATRPESQTFNPNFQRQPPNASSPPPPPHTHTQQNEQHTHARTHAESVGGSSLTSSSCAMLTWTRTTPSRSATSFAPPSSCAHRPIGTANGQLFLHRSKIRHQENGDKRGNKQFLKKCTPRLTRKVTKQALSLCTCPAHQHGSNFEDGVNTTGEAFPGTASKKKLGGVRLARETRGGGASHDGRWRTGPCTPPPLPTTFAPR
eukprot:COSAG04_NODE_820_length_10059_cov_4.579116_9_plen_227_part_00